MRREQLTDVGQRCRGVLIKFSAQVERDPSHLFSIISVRVFDERIENFPHEALTGYPVEGLLQLQAHKFFDVLAPLLFVAGLLPLPLREGRARAGEYGRGHADKGG